MTASAAAAAGIKVVLLEAGRLAQGGSGHASGICAGEATSAFLEFQAAAGRRIARAQFEQVRRAVLDLLSTTKRLSLKSDLAASDALRFVPPGMPATPLKKELEARREAGLDAAWLAPAAMTKRLTADAEGGARLAPWAVCDPYQLTLAFAAAAAARGARLYEQTAVEKIEFDRVRATIVTPAGRIVTPCVVHATGGPTGLVPGLKRHFRCETRWMVLSDVLPSPVRKALGARDHVIYDVCRPPHRIRWTGDHRVLVSGADAAPAKPAQEAKLAVGHTGELMYELSRIFPDISGVMPAYGWPLAIAHGVDGGLFVGPHRNFPHQLFAFGTGHDPARAFLASRVVMRHFQGATVSDDEHFGFARVL